MRHINKIDDFLAKCEEALVVVLFSALVLLTLFNIISRNLLHVSFQKILEITPVLVLWLALVGSTMALKKQRHIKIELLLRFCSEKVRFIAIIVSCAFGTTVMGILFWASLEFVKNEIKIFGQAGFFSVVFPLFFALSFFRYFVGIVSQDERMSAVSSTSSKPITDEAKK